MKTSVNAGIINVETLCVQPMGILSIMGFISEMHWKCVCKIVCFKWATPLAQIFPSESPVKLRIALVAMAKAVVWQD